MLRLTMLIYAILGTTLAGIGVVVIVSLGIYAVLPIVLAAAVGAALAVPGSWLVARQLQAL